MKHLSRISKIIRFTLIEMLVVICIIAILASLLMPGLGSALDSARMMACTNNTKQIGMGMTQYVNDYAYLPFHYDAMLKANPGEWNHWSHANCALEYMLAPYMGGVQNGWWLSSSTGLFLCPSSGARVGSDNKYYYAGVVTSSNVNNYSGLLFHYRQAYYFQRMNLLRFSAFKNPGRSTYQFCSRNKAPNSTMINGWSRESSTTPSWHGDSVAPPRPTVFLDGHTKVLTDPRYTLGEASLPYYKESWDLIAKNHNISFPDGPDICLEEY